MRGFKKRETASPAPAPKTYAEKLAFVDRIPVRPLSDAQLMRYAKAAGLRDFRGVFMRDGLPSAVRSRESAVVNLDGRSNPGTHWVCYRKRADEIDYYDSFGNLRPPAELVRYFRTSKERPITVRYNYGRDQSFDSVVCGHLCLRFLLLSQDEDEDRR